MRFAVVVRMWLVGKALLCAFVSLCEPATLFGSHKDMKTRRFSYARHPGAEGVQSKTVSGSYVGRSNIKTLKQVKGDDAASVGKPSQILPTCGEVATHGVDGGGWQFTRGGMRALTPPSTTLCVVPLPVNGED